MIVWAIIVKNSSYSYVRMATGKVLPFEKLDVGLHLAAIVMWCLRSVDNHCYICIIPAEDFIYFLTLYRPLFAALRMYGSIGKTSLSGLTPP